MLDGMHVLRLAGEQQLSMSVDCCVMGTRPDASDGGRLRFRLLQSVSNSHRGREQCMLRDYFDGCLA